MTLLDMFLQQLLRNVLNVILFTCLEDKIIERPTHTKSTRDKEIIYLLVFTKTTKEKIGNQSEKQHLLFAFC